MGVARFILAVILISGFLVENSKAAPICENMFIEIITEQRVVDQLDLNRNFSEMGISLQFNAKVSAESMFRVMGTIHRVLDYSKLTDEDRDRLNGLTISLSQGKGLPVEIFGSSIKILDTATTTSISLALLEYLGKGAPVHIKMEGLLQQYGLTATISSNLSEETLIRHYENLQSIFYVLETRFPGFTFNANYNISFANNTSSGRVYINDQQVIVYTNARYDHILNSVFNEMVHAPGSIQDRFRKFLFDIESNRSTAVFLSGLSQQTLELQTRRIMEVMEEVREDDPSATFIDPVNFYFQNATSSSRVHIGDEGFVSVSTNAKRADLRNAILNTLVRPTTSARSRLENFVKNLGSTTHIGHVSDLLGQDHIEKVYKAFELEMAVVEAKYPNAKLKDGFNISLINTTSSSKIYLGDDSVTIYTNASQDLIREFIRKNLIEYNLPIDLEHL